MDTFFYIFGSACLAGIFANTMQCSYYLFQIMHKQVPK